MGAEIAARRAAGVEPVGETSQSHTSIKVAQLCGMGQEEQAGRRGNRKMPEAGMDAWPRSCAGRGLTFRRLTRRTRTLSAYSFMVGDTS
jgi:hypothetical protein